MNSLLFYSRKDFFLVTGASSHNNQPSTDKGLTNYAMIYHNGGFITFGGITRPDNIVHPTITRFDEASRKWSTIGHMKSSRREHGVILNGESVLVVGGDQFWDPLINMWTEKCIFINKLISCEIRKPQLMRITGAALFRVYKDFGQ